MRAPLIVVTGTGTGIGKTFIAAGLVRAWARLRERVAGYKPIESGVGDAGAEDAAALSAASTFHVKHLPYAQLRAPLSPHLAARREGSVIDVRKLIAGIAQARAEADAVVVELPGGLFTPITDELFVADLAAQVDASALVLVAPDRLGVIHDAVAAFEAARARGCPPTHVLMNAAAAPDASTGTNADELRRFLGVPVFGPVARDRRDDPAFAALVSAVDAGTAVTQ